MKGINGMSNTTGYSNYSLQNMDSIYNRPCIQFEMLTQFTDLSLLADAVLCDLENVSFELKEHNKGQLKDIMVSIGLEIQKACSSKRQVRLCLLPSIMRQFNISLGKRYSESRMLFESIFFLLYAHIAPSAEWHLYLTMEDFIASYPMKNMDEEFPHTDFVNDEVLVCYRTANFAKIFSTLLESKENHMEHSVRLGARIIEGRSHRVITFGSGSPEKGLEPFARRRRFIYRKEAGVPRKTRTKSPTATASILDGLSSAPIAGTGGASANTSGSSGSRLAQLKASARSNPDFVTDAEAFLVTGTPSLSSVQSMSSTAGGVSGTSGASSFRGSSTKYFSQYKHLSPQPAQPQQDQQQQPLQQVLNYVPVSVIGGVMGVDPAGIHPNSRYYYLQEQQILQQQQQHHQQQMFQQHQNQGQQQQTFMENHPFGDISTSLGQGAAAGTAPIIGGGMDALVKATEFMENDEDVIFKRFNNNSGGGNGNGNGTSGLRSPSRYLLDAGVGGPTLPQHQQQQVPLRSSSNSSSSSTCSSLTSDSSNYPMTMATPVTPITPTTPPTASSNKRKLGDECGEWEDANRAATKIAATE